MSCLHLPPLPALSTQRLQLTTLCVRPLRPVYDVLLDDFEKGMTAARLDEIFGQVGPPPPCAGVCAGATGCDDMRHTQRSCALPRRTHAPCRAAHQLAPMSRLH